MESQTIADSNNSTSQQYYTWVDWRGKTVVVQCERPCPRHELEVMHHIDEEGNHYCPTLFLICPWCGGLAEEPEPYECNRCGKT